MSKESKTKTSLKGISPKVTVEESELLIGNKTIIRGYHTQECRPDKLKQPLKGQDVNARLGGGFYFWIEENFAHNWGTISKSKGESGLYDIYTADLNIRNCLNTVFNEIHYLFFRKKIDEAIQQFKSTKIPVALDTVNRFLADTVWKVYGIECIIFDDKPTNKPKKNLIYSEIPDLYYNKRIQVVIFDLKNVKNFELDLVNQKPKNILICLI